MRKKNAKVHVPRTVVPVNPTTVEISAYTLSSLCKNNLVGSLDLEVTGVYEYNYQMQPAHPSTQYRTILLHAVH